MGAHRRDRTWWTDGAKPVPMTDDDFADFLPAGCHCYNGHTPCGERAIFWLYAPDGEPNPGGNICRKHGEKVIAEFSRVAGERWTLIPLGVHFGIRMDAKIEA